VFLAGVGGWSEREIDVAEVTGFGSRAKEEERGVRVREGASIPVGGKAIEEGGALEFERRLSKGSINSLDVKDSLVGEPALVKEALSRLELNALELKLQLDSIDSRIDRIEPHLDGISSRTYPGEGTATTRPKAKEKIKVTLPVQRYSHPNLEAAIPVPPPVVPVDTQLRRLRGLVIALGALLVIAVTVAAYLYFDHVRRGNAETSVVTDGKSIEGEKTAVPGAKGVDVVARAPSADALRPAAGEQTRARVPSALREERPEGDAGGQEKQVAVLNSTPRKIAPMKVDNSAPPPAARGVGGIQMGGAVPSAVGADTRPVVSVAAATVPAATPPEGTTEKGPIFVPSSTLNNNVLASPKPVYPVGAHLQNVQGEVVLQAVISEKGTVESVRVVSGPVALQQAAIDAMRSWKYRPYIVNGTPVKVRTFVNFHFVTKQ
jgi:TonB family protein